MCNSNHCRHKRTHDREDGGEGPFPLSGEEEEDFSGEDQLGALEEASPSSEHGFVTNSLDSLAQPQGGLAAPATITPNQTYASSMQSLSMPMTMSHTGSVNAGGV